MKSVGLSALLIGNVLCFSSAPVLAQQYKILHSFNCAGKDGCEPFAGLVFDKAGNLYGTTLMGGANNGATQTSDDPSTYGYGTIFKLSRKPDGTWSENILHVFTNSGKNGSGASSSLVMDTAGNLYGTAEGGGAYGGGVVFEVTP